MKVLCGNQQTVKGRVCGTDEFQVCSGVVDSTSGHRDRECYDLICTR